MIASVVGGWVDLDVDVDGAAGVPARHDGAKRAASLRVGGLCAAQERAIVDGVDVSRCRRGRALVAGVDAHGVTMPDVHGDIGQRAARVGIGDGDGEVERRALLAFGDVLSYEAWSM